MEGVIIKFSGPYRFLSNFYPCRIRLGGQEYPTLEHAYQASKTRILKEREDIRLASTPGQAKRLGRQVTLQEHWEDIKVVTMEALLRLKFMDVALQESLLLTSDTILIEGNHWHDNFWGVCYCQRCSGQGENQLGRLLMQVREEIIDTQGGEIK